MRPDRTATRGVDLGRPIMPVVAHTIAHLKGREARVLGLRFGLVRGPRTLAGMSDEMGLSQQRVSQVEASAIRRCARIVDWPGRLDRHFARLSLHAPVPLPRVSAEPWAAGMSGESLLYVLRAFGRPYLHVAERKRPREGEVPVLVPMAELHWRKGLTVASNVLSAATPGQGWEATLERVWDAVPGWPVAWRSVLLDYLTDGLPGGDVALLRFRHGRKAFLNGHLQAGVEARERRAWGAPSPSTGVRTAFTMGAGRDASSIAGDADGP